VERAEVKVFAKRQRFKKLFKHATSPKSLAPVIHAFRKSCIHTSYMERGSGAVSDDRKLSVGFCY
jgi:hypothetical protein